MGSIWIRFIRLFSPDLEKRNPLVPVESLTPEVAFEIKEGEVGGKKGSFLCFANKLDLFKFFISEDAKTIQYLDIDPGQIEEKGIGVDEDSCCGEETSFCGADVEEKLKEILILSTFVKICKWQRRSSWCGVGNCI